MSAESQLAEIRSVASGRSDRHDCSPEVSDLLGQLEQSPTFGAAKKKQLSSDEVKAMLAKLTEHFGEPVQPVRQYCAALNLWASALRMKAERLEVIAIEKTASDASEESKASAKEDAENAEKFARDVGHVFMQITKSNLLSRLIYDGESLRTEMSPVHKGRWSGCKWATEDDKNCKCQHAQAGGIGINVTGWLP